MTAALTVSAVGVARLFYHKVSRNGNDFFCRLSRVTPLMCNAAEFFGDAGRLRGSGGPKLRRLAGVKGPPQIL
jgi:hypothetical protein